MAVEHLDMIGVPDSVGDPTIVRLWTPVRLPVGVEVGDAVSRKLVVGAAVAVVVLELVIEAVLVFVVKEVAESVGLADPDFDGLIVTVAVPLPVVVFVGASVVVSLTDLSPLRLDGGEALVVGVAVSVFEARILCVPVGELVAVLDPRALGVKVGLAVEVLLLKVDAVPVRVTRMLREAAGDAVAVFELVDEPVTPGEFELDLDWGAVLVAYFDTRLVYVFIELIDGACEGAPV